MATGIDIADLHSMIKEQIIYRMLDMLIKL